MSGAYGLVLDGRKIRIERAKAERELARNLPSLGRKLMMFYRCCHLDQG